jgi:hypothetical protein
MVCSAFPKTLALHLGQSKPLDWPAASEPMHDWRELIGRMLRIDDTERISLKEVGVVAAALPASATLEGVSLAAKADASRPIVLPGDTPGGSTQQSSSLPPVPSRPSQPIATEIRHDRLVLLWEPPPKAEIVDSYEVFAQVSGSGGFLSLLPDTNSPHPIVRLETLAGNTWYEFRVVARNAAGSSPQSTTSDPVQTAMSPAAQARQAEHAAAAAAMASSLGAANAPTRSPRLSSREADAAEDPDLMLRYAQSKRDLLNWEAHFDRAHGRASTDHDRNADLHYQGLMQRYKKLKHAKRKLMRSATSPASLSPRALDSLQQQSSESLLSPVGPSANPTTEGAAEHIGAPPLHATLGQHSSGYFKPQPISSGAVGLSSNCFVPPFERSGGAHASSSDDTPPSSSPVATSPPSSHVHRRHSPGPQSGHGGGANATGAGERADGGRRTAHDASPPAERPGPSTPPRKPKSPSSKGSSSKKGRHHRGSGASKTGAAAAAAAGGGGDSGSVEPSLAMTVALKASHPSPRALGASEETFE